MQTGEGKTLVATLAAYLNALEGKGVHVVTVNDYLAKRDCEWCVSRPIWVMSEPVARALCKYTPCNERPLIAAHYPGDGAEISSCPAGPRKYLS